MPATIQRFLWPLSFTVIGGVLAYIIFPIETELVREQLIGYPDADKFSHGLRPLLLVVLCFLPALAALLHTLSSTLDRYLTRELLGCFGICFSSLVGMLFLLELQNNASEFKEATMSQILIFYLTQLPSMLMMILPYSLMLSLLWCLGKMSKSQEIVSMIQSGRSVLRIMVPLIVAGVFLTTATTIFSFHWAPYGEGYKEALMDELKGDKHVAAKNVGYGTVKHRRMWSVGIFPRDFSKGAPLETVWVHQYDDEKNPHTSYRASKATWNEESKNWLLEDLSVWQFQDDKGNTLISPLNSKVAELTMDWEETPWQVIRPGLDPAHLGIPELNSWLKNHEKTPLDFRRSYQTWWHFRWAQPAICIVIVLLAAPLGIAFTRRGVGGGVAVAIFLCAGMLFCSTVFPTLGESGHLSPALAAWATNIVFLSVAVVLFYRRLSGQPIYQTIKKILPF